MKTIYDVLEFADDEGTSNTLLNLIDDQIALCKNSGDLLGVGEWLVSKLRFLEKEQLEETLVGALTAWASPFELRTFPTNLEELVSRMHEFVPEELAISWISVLHRFRDKSGAISRDMDDLAFRLSEQISSVFDVHQRRPVERLDAALAKIDMLLSELLRAVDLFLNTNCLTAKVASIEVVKKMHQVRKLLLAAERQVLNEIDVVLGPSLVLST